MHQTLLGYEINQFNTSRSIDTRERVCQLRFNDIYMTMSEIARLVGISRQRVFQILQENGLPTKHLVRQINKYRYNCPVCGKISINKFCSDECKKQWQQIPVVCTKCGKLFFRDIHKFLYNYRDHNETIFCGRNCQSKWIGEHYGFKSYPNHSGPGAKRKHNWDDVWNSHVETGYGPVKLSRQLGIPKTTIAYILFHHPKQIC